MNDENNKLERAEIERQEEWVAPEPPEKIVVDNEKSTMSEVGTLGNIFLEPGKTFEDLRIKPRWIIAFLVMSILMVAFSLAFQSRLGQDRIRQSVVEALSKDPRFDSMPKEQATSTINMQMTISKYFPYLSPLFILFAFFLGALLYWGGTAAMGGRIRFFQSLSVWTYASFPPTVVSLVGSFLVLFLKNPDDIDIAASRNGLVRADLSFLVNPKTMPIAYTFLGDISLFTIWGLVLSAIGLRIVGKLTSSSAWAIVLIIHILLLGIRILFAAISGSPS